MDESRDLERKDLDIEDQEPGKVRGPDIDIFTIPGDIWWKDLIVGVNECVERCRTLPRSERIKCIMDCAKPRFYDSIILRFPELRTIPEGKLVYLEIRLPLRTRIPEEQPQSPVERS